MAFQEAKSAIAGPVIEKNVKSSQAEEIKAEPNFKVKVVRGAQPEISQQAETSSLKKEKR